MVFVKIGVSALRLSLVFMLRYNIGGQATQGSVPGSLLEIGGYMYFPNSVKNVRI